MRGEESPQPQMFSYVDLESRVPRHHPKQLLRAVLLPVFFSIRSERLLVE